MSYMHFEQNIESYYRSTFSILINSSTLRPCSMQLKKNHFVILSDNFSGKFHDNGIQHTSIL